MLAAITQKVLADRASPAGVGLWQTSTYEYQDQPTSRHAMSLFGLRRKLYSMFQFAYQFVKRFDKRVGRVWASVRWEFRIAWA